MSNKQDDLLQQSINEVVKEQASNAEKTPKQFINDLKTDVQAKDPRALSTLNDLVNLIVITHQEKTILYSGLGQIASRFMEEPDADLKGNGKRFIKHFLKKPTDFDPNKFVPNNEAAEFSDLSQKVVFIEFLDKQGQLKAGSVRKMWKIVYQEPKLITYFVNGQLREFIEEQIKEHIGDSVITYLYDTIMNKLVDANAGGHKMTGKAENLFKCLTDEVLPTIQEMFLNSNKFNKDSTLVEAIDASKKEDLLMIVNPKVKVMLETNIRSQLYNAAKLDLNNFVGEIHASNHKFDFTTPTVQANDEYYVGEDTLIVVDTKSFLKGIKMLEIAGSQDFILNISKMKIFHLWWVFDYLPWGKRFIYTNANLTVSPN